MRTVVGAGVAMGVCGDPLVEAIKDLGYNVLAVPGQDFAPLQLLRSDGRRTLRQLGFLARELTSDSPLPTVRTGEPVRDLSVTKSRRLSGSLGAKVLGCLLEAVGASPAVTVELSRESGTSVVITDVTRDWISEGDLAAYLEHGVLARTERTRQLAEERQLWVVTAVLRSRELRVETSTAAAARIEAAAGTVGGAPKVEVSGASAGTTTLTYPAKTSLPFGFQAVRLAHRDGRWSNFTDADGRISYAAPGGGKPLRGLLILDDDLVEYDARGDHGWEDAS